jgi:formate hydrogenlyase subunit 3/multisubunit Na+/H+ antiporter MnhD subunit
VPGFIDDLKQKIDTMLKLAVAGAIAAAAATVAFFCFAISLFLWVQQNYSTLDAWVAIGTLFVVVAIACGIVMIVVRKRRPAARSEPKRREQPSAVSRLLQEPAVLLTGLQIVRILGPRVIVPVILLGAVAGGLLMGRNGHSHRDAHESAEAHERDQGFDAG